MGRRLGIGQMLRNSVTLAGGTAGAQVLPFLFYPLLGRLFTAGEFGLLAAVTSIASVLAVAGSGKYEAGILVARHRDEAAHLAVLSVALGAVAMVLAWAVMQPALAEPLSRWFDEPALARWLWVCPLGAFFIIIYNVYNEWCVREGYFQSLSLNKIVNSGAVTLGKVVLGLVKVCGQGLVVGDLVGRGVGAAVCVARWWLRDRVAFAQVRLSKIRKVAAVYKEFPLYTMPGALLNTIAQAVPVLLVAYYLDKEHVGHFSMAMTLFAVPINVVSSAVRDVYRQRANEEYASQGNCLRSFDRVMWTLSAVAVGGFLLFEWFLPRLTGFFLGPGWETAGRYAQILAPAMVVMFVSNALSGIFVVAGKLRQFFWWQVYFAVVTIISVWIGGELVGSMEAILVLLAAGRATAYVASIVATRRYAAGDRRNPSNERIQG